MGLSTPRERKSGKHQLKCNSSAAAADDSRTGWSIILKSNLIKAFNIEWALYFRFLHGRKCTGPFMEEESSAKFGFVFYPWGKCMEKTWTVISCSEVACCRRPSLSYRLYEACIYRVNNDKSFLMHILINYIICSGIHATIAVHDKRCCKGIASPSCARTTDSQVNWINL